MQSQQGFFQLNDFNMQNICMFELQTDTCKTITTSNSNAAFLKYLSSILKRKEKQNKYFIKNLPFLMELQNLPLVELTVSQ